MTTQEITDLIKSAIDEVAPGKSANFNPSNLDTSIREAGIDSVASMEMIAVIEEELEINFADDELAGINTFTDLVNLVEKSSK